MDIIYSASFRNWRAFHRAAGDEVCVSLISYYWNIFYKYSHVYLSTFASPHYSVFQHNLHLGKYILMPFSVSFRCCLTGIVVSSCATQDKHIPVHRTSILPLRSQTPPSTPTTIAVSPCNYNVRVSRKHERDRIARSCRSWRIARGRPAPTLQKTYDQGARVWQDVGAIPRARHDR